MSSFALRSSLQLYDSDKQHFTERIESALSAGRISQQQATDMKSIFSSEREGDSVDVKFVRPWFLFDLKDRVPLK